MLRELVFVLRSISGENRPFSKLANAELWSTHQNSGDALRGQKPRRGDDARVAIGRVAVLIGWLLLGGGILLILWGAERFTDGAIRTATRFGLSTFYIGAIASGFEPENLATGITAAAEGLPGIALGTVIGAAVFMLTGGLGVALLLVPMDVRIPRAGAVAMLGTLVPFAIVLWNDGVVSRLEGAALIAVAVGVMVGLYRRSPVFVSTTDADGDEGLGPSSTVRVVSLLVLGIAVMVAGAELVVHGARRLLATVNLTETFLGMVVIGLGESAEETARMVTPARRGHPELAWGNVVGTVVVLVAFNLGLIALARPLAVDPLVLRFHAPYLMGCTILVAMALLSARRLGRRMGLALVALYLLYLGINVWQIWG